MVVADLADQVLTIDGTNKAGRIALFGAGHSDGPVRIAVSDIAGVDFKKASALTNGNLTVRTHQGAKYQLHFRKKSGAAFEALASAIKG